MKLNEYYDFRDIATIDVYIDYVVSDEYGECLSKGTHVLHLSADAEPNFCFFCGNHHGGPGHWIDARGIISNAIHSGGDEYISDRPVTCRQDSGRCDGHNCGNSYLLRVVISRDPTVTRS